MGMFNKQSTPTSPAQQAYDDAVNQQVEHYMKTWMPVQSYFTEQNEQNHYALQDIDRGQTAAAAQLQTDKISAGLLAQDEQHGAEPGSGAYTATMEKSTEMGATAKGLGLTGADIETQRAYLQGVQKALGMYQTDSSMAMNSMRIAAQEQQGEALLNTDINNSRMATEGQIAAMGLGSAVKGYSGGIMADQGYDPSGISYSINQSNVAQHEGDI